MVAIVLIGNGMPASLERRFSQMKYYQCDLLRAIIHLKFKIKTVTSYKVNLHYLRYQRGEKCSRRLRRMKFLKHFKGSDCINWFWKARGLERRFSQMKCYQRDLRRATINLKVKIKTLSSYKVNLHYLRYQRGEKFSRRLRRM